MFRFFKKVPYSENLPATIKGLVENHCVVYISDVPADVDAEQFYIELADKVGTLLRKDENPLTGKISNNAWTEIKFTAEKKNLAYKFSDKRQPLHTDYCYFPFVMNLSLIHISEPTRP